MSIPDDIAMYTFDTRIDMESAQELNLLAGGSFENQTLVERREILEFFLETSSSHIVYNEPHLESELVHESLSIAESELSFSEFLDSSVEPSPEPRTSKEEEIQPSELSSRFEDDPSRNIKIAQITLGTRSLRHRWTFMRSSMKFGIMER